MAGSSSRAERRRHPRTEVAASCKVFSPARHLGTYRVCDLSAGGACLIGDLPLPRGSTLQLLLQLPRRPALGIAARVIRSHRADRGRRFAVAFLDLEAEQEDLIHQGIVAELER